jgi:tetratricopeptide (TPR) repeat protein
MAADRVIMDAGMPDQPRPTCRAVRPWMASCILFALLLLAYWNSFHAPLIFDDVPNLVENPNVRLLTERPLAAAWAPVDVPGHGRPIAALSFAINYAIGGLDPLGYHVVNFALHVLCACVLMGLVRRTLARALPSIDDGRAMAIGFVVACIWAVHPLLSESVVYISQRTELLASLFIVLTLYCVARSWTASVRRRWWGAAVACCIAAMLSKEIGAMTPLLVLLLDRQFHAGTFRAAWRSAKPMYVALFACLLIPAIMIPLTRRFYHPPGDMFQTISPYHYLLTQASVLVLYLRLLIWPRGLSIWHEMEIAHSLREAMPELLLVAALAAITAWGLWRRTWWSLPAAACFLILAPTSSIVPIVREIAAERRMYLPAACLVTIAVVGTARTPIGRGWPGAVVVSMLVAILAARTVWRVGDYESPVRIWQAAVDVVPTSSVARTNLAAALMAERRFDDAWPHVQAAVAANPNNGEARLNHAILLNHRGDASSALAELELAERHGAYTPRVWFQRGVIYQATDPDRAMDAYRRAIELDEHFVPARENLGVMLALAGRPAEAAAHFQRALWMKPDSLVSLTNLAALMLGENRTDEATELVERALATEPRNVSALNLSGILHARRGDPEAALAAFRAAAQADGASFEAWKNMGIIYERTGRRNEAVAAYRRAISLRPDAADVAAALARLEPGSP